MLDDATASPADAKDGTKSDKGLESFSAASLLSYESTPQARAGKGAAKP